MRNQFLLIAVLATGAAAQGLSGMAVGVLEQSRQAVTALQQNDRAAAADHITQAKALAAQILQTRTADSQPVMIETRRQVETTTTYADVKKSKSSEMSADRLKENTNVAGVDRQTTAYLLNVNSASQHLDAAQSALDRNDLDSASVALRAVPYDVVQTDLPSDEPLMRAQANLELARSRVLDGDSKAARVPLQAAAQALADYQRLYPGPNGEDAEYMRQEMLAYVPKLGQSETDTVDRINIMWLDKIQKWEKRGGLMHHLDTNVKKLP